MTTDTSKEKNEQINFRISKEFRELLDGLVDAESRETGYSLHRSDIIEAAVKKYAEEKARGGRRKP